MDRRDHGGVDETTIRERHEIHVVVEQVELGRSLEHGRDVQALRTPSRPDPDPPEYPVGIVPTSVADVSESAVANSVTSTPRATSPSVKRETNCSHGP